MNFESGFLLTAARSRGNQAAVNELMLQAPAWMLRRGPPSYHANLSSMFPHRPRAFNVESDAEFAMNIAQAETVEAAVPEHHSQVCPACSTRLSGYRCKLVCGQCGYYMSCADYY
jgi:hypothetical protein